jgi:hypothetical protein
MTLLRECFWCWYGWVVFLGGVELNGCSVHTTVQDPTYFDDEVKAVNPAKCGAGSEITHTLHDAASGVETKLHVSPEFRFLQIFTGAKSIWGVDAVVLEPLSASAHPLVSQPISFLLFIPIPFFLDFGIAPVREGCGSLVTESSQNRLRGVWLGSHKIGHSLSEPRLLPAAAS